MKLHLSFLKRVPLFIGFLFLTEKPLAQGSRMTDSLELVSLYNATNGTNWTNKWILTQPMTAWYGITLNTDGRVERINLYRNQLRGIIPNFNLPNLKGLWLSFNQISGNIPNFNLPNLQYLYLYANQISGSIPNFNLPNLQVLDLDNNQLTGSIPNFNLPNLQWLILSFNQLSGNIPNLNLSNLKNLSLYSNQLNGSIPNFSLPNLRELTLCYNQLSDSIPNFNLPNLQNLSLNDNQLSGSIPNFNLPNLQQLLLDKNLLSGSIPNFDLPNLQTLYLDNNQLSGCIPASIKTNCPLITAAGGHLFPNPNLATQIWINYWNNGEGACSPTATVESSTETFNVSIYPNPTNGEVHIKGFDVKVGFHDMTIMDMTGRTVFHQTTYWQNNELVVILPTVQWVKGTYWLRISNGDKTILKKLVLL